MFQLPVFPLYFIEKNGSDFNLQLIANLRGQSRVARALLLWRRFFGGPIELGPTCSFSVTDLLPCHPSLSIPLV